MVKDISLKCMENVATFQSVITSQYRLSGDSYTELTTWSIHYSIGQVRDSTANDLPQCTIIIIMPNKLLDKIQEIFSHGVQE